MKYLAVAKVNKGDTLRAVGTINEIANWLENVVRINGSCRIDIERLDDEK